MPLTEEQSTVHALYYAPLWALSAAVYMAESAVRDAVKPWGLERYSGKPYAPQEVPEVEAPVDGDDALERVNLNEHELAEAVARLAGLRAFRDALLVCQRLTALNRHLATGWRDAEDAEEE